MIARILIVDDNVLFGFVLRSMLQDEGYEVDTAGSAQEGYSAFLGNRPDLIVTDINMPGGSGPEMVKEIRRHDPQVPVIYMSGDWTRLQSVMEAEEPGSCVKSLKKPFRQNDLLMLISECLSSPGRGFPPTIAPPFGAEACTCLSALGG
jgi:two-component system, response regulator FlrC